MTMLIDMISEMKKSLILLNKNRDAEEESESKLASYRKAITRHRTSSIDELEKYYQEKVALEELKKSCLASERDYLSHAQPLANILADFPGRKFKFMLQENSEEISAYIDEDGKAQLGVKTTQAEIVRDSHD